MSVLFVLIYIQKGNALRRCLLKKLNGDDVAFLELFSHILIGRDNCLDEISRGLEEGIRLEWEDVCDFVNPFGDARGRAFNSVWTFDLDKDVLFLTKQDRVRSAPLSLARDRLLTMDDFEMVQLPTEAIAEEKFTLGPYWDLQPEADHRRRVFLGRILRDFGHTWRHLLRREMNNITFTKLAYAIIWILNLDFTVVERTGFEHVAGRGGPYVGVADFPRWDTPEERIVKVGSCWFTLEKDIPRGLQMIREHMETLAATTDSTTSTATYAILTLEQIACCKVRDGDLVCARPESLYGDKPPSDSAINLIIWASDLHQATPKPCRLKNLSVEVQDRILRHATTSTVSAAKLGIELALGSPFSWTEGCRKIRLEEVLRHRTEASPIESQIFFNGVMSGLSYKCEATPMRFKVDMSSLPAPPRPTAAVPPP
ncbi:fatty acid hydroxylase [Fusarium denticulatum]|uniref:Fatty acid hydroxylase n=1 Tax=Fusarium denticulatum TaxID=48507 RepID=A0A8H5SQX3_9HYPO|nr:fatty acid hydroxylase [Fusarium denticulatum]